MATQSSQHEHSSWQTRVESYRGCVAPSKCDPGSHDHVTFFEHCSCGAVRRTNVNNHHTESSGWTLEEGDQK